MGRQAEQAEKTGPEVAKKVRRMAGTWRWEGSEKYDRETFAEFERSVDQDRSSFRKLFPEDDAKEGWEIAAHRASGIVLLDAGPLGMISHPEAAEKNVAAFEWFVSLLDARVVVEISEISDYEVRRELLRAGKDQSVARLADLAEEIGYRPLNTEVMRRASLWAKARNEGMPTAPAVALGADVILAAQALEAADDAGTAVVATTNSRQISRFANAQNWQEIEPWSNLRERTS